MTREELAKKVALNKENQRKKAEQKEKRQTIKKERFFFRLYIISLTSKQSGTLELILQ